MLHLSAAIQLETLSAGLSKQKEAFLPFWITSATIVSDLRSAEVSSGTSGRGVQRS